MSTRSSFVFFSEEVDGNDDHLGNNPTTSTMAVTIREAVKSVDDDNNIEYEDGDDNIHNKKRSLSLSLLMDPNQLLQKCVLWLDDDDDDDDDNNRLLFKRCIVCALTSTIGSMIGSKKSFSGRSSTKQQQSSSIEYWLEVLSFAIQGGFVAGPLSYYVYVVVVLFVVVVVVVHTVIFFAFFLFWHVCCDTSTNSRFCHFFVFSSILYQKN
jgi:hypothetical protein